MSDIRLGLNTVGPASGALESTRPGLARDKGDAGLFKEALTKAQPTVQPGASAPTSPLKFSNHAVDRMQARGIRFSLEDMAKIGGAVQKAQAKGAKQCLLLADQAALIVSLKDNTVVTVMDKANLKENVFTNIDSTVMI